MFNRIFNYVCHYSCLQKENFVCHQLGYIICFLGKLCILGKYLFILNTRNLRIPPSPGWTMYGFTAFADWLEVKLTPGLLRSVSSSQTVA